MGGGLEVMRMRGVRGALTDEHHQNNTDQYSYRLSEDVTV